MHAFDTSAEPAQVRPRSTYLRFVELTSRPHAALFIALCAFTLSLPALASGLVADDFDLGFAVRADPWSAYAFMPRDDAQRQSLLQALRTAGDVPWWTDPEFHQAFFRPLSSLSLALDFALFPSAPWLMHLENSILFALIVLVAAGLYRDFGLPRRARGVATAFFAVQGAQSMTTGWISGRNTLLATLFGFLALRACTAGQRMSTTKARGRSTLLNALAVLAFAAALGCAEAGVATLAYVAAYALCLGAGAPAAGEAPRPGGAWARLRASLPALSGFGIVLCAWLVAYALLGYGVRNSGFYVDLRHDPLRFALDLSYAIPIYLATQLTLPFASLSVLWPWAPLLMAAASLVILFLSRGLWLPWLRRDAHARALGLGALLSIVPLGSSPPQDRLVSFIAFGVCGLIALIVEERLGATHSPLPQRGARRLWRYHAMWAPALYIPFLFSSQSMVAGGGAKLLDHALEADTQPALLINAPSQLVVHICEQKRRWFGEAAPHIDLLYAGLSEVELTSAGERSLELSVPAGYFRTRVEQITRDPSRRPLQVGERIRSGGMEAQVLAVRDGAPTRVRFDFTQPLTQLRAYAWQGREIERLVLPEFGESVQIRAASAL